MWNYLKRKDAQHKSLLIFSYRRYSKTQVDVLFLCYVLFLLFCQFSQSICDQKFTSKHVSPGFTSGKGWLEILSWAVQLKEGSGLRYADISYKLGKQLNLTNGGQIGSLQDHYLLTHPVHIKHAEKKWLMGKEKFGKFDRKALPDSWNYITNANFNWTYYGAEIEAAFDKHPAVVSYSRQIIRPRYKRNVELKFVDPNYAQQWHLNNEYLKHMDINVWPVWERNITGRGVTAAVVDDGLQWDNPDLIDNYDADASYDLNGKGPDPRPSSTSAKNHHGTRCAGEIAAVANSVCGVGVAFHAKIAGLKVLDGPMTDSLEAEAFTKNIHKIDVYSCSWGPDDDGKTVDGPHHLALKAMKHAVDYGRKGYGSVFVVASGNGGVVGDNCNFDGYANSVYTVTVGAVDEFGEMPYYAEECASMLAVTFSSGGPRARQIVTTDWTLNGGTGCTKSHTGTSAAAPLAAGMIALMFDAQPCLTWRDVQHIIVMAAKKVDIDIAHWYTNAAGFHHSHKHGFGLMDAWRLVNTAKVWEPVPWMTIFTSKEIELNKPIPGSNKPLIVKFNATKENLNGYTLYTLEYVHITVTIDHQQRGALEVQLKCPSGTSSVLGAPRKLDKSSDGFKEWRFSTVRCWGEEPEGVWELLIKDTMSEYSRGTLRKWQLHLYGSALSKQDIGYRRRLVEEAIKGHNLFDNHTSTCYPAPLRNHLVIPISERVLKIVVLTSAFCVVLGIYQTLEYIFCYNDEKEEHRKLRKKHLRDKHKAEQETNLNNIDSLTESTALLNAEDLPIQSLPLIQTDFNGVLVPNSTTTETSFIENSANLTHSSFDTYSLNCNNMIANDEYHEVLEDIKP